MDLIPKPDQLIAAAGNVAHGILYGGLADLRPMPRTLIDDGPLREVYHYRPERGTHEVGEPVLLVTPLAAPAICYDLRRGCSLVEHFVQQGRPTYLVEYGRISFKDRDLGMEHWVREIVPEAIKAASEHAGGKPVHVVGWSLGGIFSLLVAADRPYLPIASVTAVGSPIDVDAVPLVAPLRPLVGVADGAVLTSLYRILGGAPQPVVRRAFQFSSVQKVITKPYVRLRNLDDADFLAQLEAVDRFGANMIAYPGRTFGQLYHRMVKGNVLKSGSMEIDGHDIELADVRVPVLVFAGNTDGIAPIGAVRPLVDLLTGAPEVRFEVVPGGHLGMLTGRAARSTTWQVLDDWIREHETRVPVPVPDLAPEPKKTPKQAATKKAATKKAATKKAPAKKAAAKKTAAKKTATKKTAARRDAIGANPTRSFSSSSSRALGANSTRKRTGK